MATRRNGRGNTNAKRYKWIGHIQVDFNDDERNKVLAYVSERSFDFENVLSVISQKSISVKFTYDDSADCYQITLQPKDRASYVYGYTLGFKHVDLTRCLQITQYIVEEMLEHEAIELPDNSSSPDW